MGCKVVKTKSVEEAERSWVEGSIRRAYFYDTKGLTWIVGIIRSSSLRGKELLGIITKLGKAYPQYSEKVNALVKRCKEEGFL